MGVTSWIMTALLSLGTAILIISLAFSKPVISHDDLMTDVRQLAEIVETVHPDPNRNCGGKIAFHRELQSTMAAIPKSGVSREEFYCLLNPFVTMLRDAHTWLKAPDEFAYGLPLYLEAAGRTLCVAGVPTEDYEDLLGAILVSVEGVPNDELISRARGFVSGENDYQVLRNLSGTGMLFNKWFLDRLVPRCRGKKEVAVTLQHVDGSIMTHKLKCSRFSGLGSYVWFESGFSMPD